MVTRPASFKLLISGQNMLDHTLSHTTTTTRKVLLFASSFACFVRLDSHDISDGFLRLFRRRV